MASNVYKINGAALRLPVVSSDPPSPVNGAIWYNSTDNVFRKYENGSTSELGSGEVEAIDVSYDNTASELTAENIQAAIDEIDSRIDDLEGLDPMEYLGTWNASTNTPELANGTGNTGDVYHVSAGGTVDFGAGNITFDTGDKVVYNGATYEKWDLTDAVTSVNGETGAVTLDADDIDDSATNNKFATADQLTKVDYLTVTQAVDLDDMESKADSALQSLSDDTAPSLGGDLTLGDNTVIHDSNGVQIGTSSSDFYEHEYIHATTLTASQSSTVAAALTFAHASFEGMLVEYKIKEATTNRVRIGQLYISTNGTDTSIVDTFGETGDVGVSWDLNISGADVQVRYTTTANNKTMRAIAKRIKV